MENSGKRTFRFSFDTTEENERRQGERQLSATLPKPSVGIPAEPVDTEPRKGGEGEQRIARMVGYPRRLLLWLSHWGARAGIEKETEGGGSGTVFSHEMAAIRERRAQNGRNPETGSFETPPPEGLAPTPAHPPSGDPADQNPPDTIASTSLGLVGIGLSGGGQRSAIFCLGALQGLYSVLPKQAAPQSPREKPSDLAAIDYISSVSGGGYINACLMLGLSRSKGRFPFGLTSNDAGETPTTRHLRDNSRYLVSGGFLGVSSFFIIYLRGVMAGLIAILPILLIGVLILLALAPTIHHLEEPREAIQALFVEPDYRTSLMPVTMYRLSVVAVIFLAIYVVLVSRLGNVPLLSKRQAYAKLIVSIAVFLTLPALIEIHLAILRLYFIQMRGLLSSPEVSGSNFNIGKFFKALLDAAPWLAGLAALILPFIRQLGETAAKEITGTYGALIRKFASKAILLLAAAIMPLLIWLGMLAMTIWGVENSLSTPCTSNCYPFAPTQLARLFTWVQEWSIVKQWGVDKSSVVLLVYTSFMACLLLLWLTVDVNANSLHQVYRDRLAQAYLVSEKALLTNTPGLKKQKLNSDDRFALSAVNTRIAPYPLFNTALNIPGSAWANQRGRNAEFFIYSPRFIGSALTGYIQTDATEKLVSTFNLGTVMAVSGAAAAPNMGMASVAPMSPTLAFLNVRLGRWAWNPRSLAKISATTTPQSWWFRKGPGPRWLLREAFSKTGFLFRKEENAFATSNSDRFVFLSDGGHIENLGVYELLRRRCKLVICVDAEHDPALASPSLAQLERFARIDLGTRIRIDISEITAQHRSASGAYLDPSRPLPRVGQRSGPHVALGLIDYPPSSTGGAREVGVLLYVKPSLSGDENNYLVAYKRMQPTFPQESTSDQFFTEEQFEAYRALGEHIVRRMLDGSDPVSAPNSIMTSAEKARLLTIVNARLPGVNVR